MGGKEFAELDERAHDRNVDLNRPFAFEHTGEHGYPAAILIHIYNNNICSL